MLIHPLKNVAVAQSLVAVRLCIPIHVKENDILASLSLLRYVQTVVVQKSKQIRCGYDIRRMTCDGTDQEV